VCAALTASLDEALRDLGSGLGSGVAVVALGGYGRGEQCIWSDVDVMLLHEHTDPELLVRSVLYPLWDADLKVGHAVRTVSENREAAADDFETLTSLLSARLVCGDKALYAEYELMLIELIRKKPLASALVAAERQRRVDDPYPSMAADVKSGRGGLRTHHGFWWERRRAELLGLPLDEPTADESEARARLLSIRNALHAAAGRSTDRFLFDLREPAAAWLGTDVLSMAADLTSALHVGDGLADQRWPDLHAEQDPMVGLGRRVLGAVRSRFSAPAISDEPSARILATAVAAAGRKDGAWFTGAEEAAIAAAPTQEWTAGDRADFVLLLGSGARGRTIFGRLEALGWVERAFPEWGAVATAPQLAPFHDHPVGAHLWRAVDEMRLLIEGSGPPREIADEIGSTEELLLAAFLHDIGKARGGNHAVVGAGLAVAFLRRCGFGPATVGVVVDSIRLHLLLSETATRRDTADLDVINEVAALIGDVRRLDVLYLLTIADLRATGTTMWNEWRAVLIQGLYRRVREAIAAGGASPATPSVDSIVEAAGETVDRREIEEHVAAMPADYLESTSPQEALWHIAVANTLAGDAAACLDTAADGRVLVAGSDRAGFLLAVARAFTANGIGILDARLRTREDGIAIDTFHVAADHSGGAVPSEKWGAVTADLNAVLNGEQDLRPVIKERVTTYSGSTEESPTDVRTRLEGRYTVVEVRAPDRIGLLADIVDALHGDGLDIHLARIDTMGGEARDVFHVRRVGGIPVRDESELASLQARLEDKLSG
jgi:[protein-PII] uridylyltransferase